MKSRHVGALDAKLRHALDVPIPTLRRVGVEHEYIVQRAGETGSTSVATSIGWASLVERWIPVIPMRTGVNGVGS